MIPATRYRLIVLRSSTSCMCVCVQGMIRGIVQLRKSAIKAMTAILCFANPVHSKYSVRATGSENSTCELRVRRPSKGIDKQLPAISRTSIRPRSARTAHILFKFSFKEKNANMQDVSCKWLNHYLPDSPFQWSVASFHAMSAKIKHTHMWCNGCKHTHLWL
jgi:hypothetical protein